MDGGFRVVGRLQPGSARGLTRLVQGSKPRALIRRQRKVFDVVRALVGREEAGTVVGRRLVGKVAEQCTGCPEKTGADNAADDSADDSARARRAALRLLAENHSPCRTTSASQQTTGNTEANRRSMAVASAGKVLLCNGIENRRTLASASSSTHVVPEAAVVSPRARQTLILGSSMIFLS